MNIEKSRKSTLPLKYKHWHQKNPMLYVCYATGYTKHWQDNRLTFFFLWYSWRILLMRSNSYKKEKKRILNSGQSTKGWNTVQPFNPCCKISHLDGAVKEFEGGGEVQWEAGRANRIGEMRHGLTTKRLGAIFQTWNQSMCKMLLQRSHEKQTSPAVFTAEQKQHHIYFVYRWKAQSSVLCRCGDGVLQMFVWLVKFSTFKYGFSPNILWNMCLLLCISFNGVG